MFLLFSDQFCEYFRIVRNLKFDEAPDYDLLKNLFADVYKLNKFADDGLFDWSNKKI